MRRPLQRYGHAPGGGHGPEIVQPNGADPEKIVAPNRVHVKLALIPRPYRQDLPAGVRLTPATPTIAAVQDAQRLIPMIVAQAEALPIPQAVAPQHVTL